LSAADEPEKRDGFLARWSRRKRGEAAEPKPLSEPHEIEPTSEMVEVEEDFDLSLLPDIESITAESDVTLFFKKGVPEALKNAALRKIWTADPAIRDFVAPADFQWDFNAPDGVPGFGSLESGIDMKAMLRQAVGEPAPEADAPVETSPVEAGKAVPREGVAGSESPPMPDEEPPGEGPPELAQRAPEGFSVSQDSKSENANSETEADSGMKLPVLARKHGGALPT
jgi:hypothetical protein